MLGESFKEEEMEVEDLAFYDFNNVVTEKSCSTGTDRVPVELFRDFQLITKENSSVPSIEELSDPKLFKKLVSDIGFPVHLYTREELVEISVRHFENFGLVSALNEEKNPTTLTNLITCLARRY